MFNDGYNVYQKLSPNIKYFEYVLLVIDASIFQVVWACNLCRKKQELLAKTGAWYHGGMARPVALDVGNAPEGMGVSLRPSSRVIDTSPPNEKKAKMGFSGDTGSGSEKENIDRQKSFGRTSSLQGRELKRQYSMSDAPTSRSGLEGTSQATGTGMIDGPVVADGDFKQGQERGRVKERTSAKHRFHSESRISETDKRYAALPQPDSAHQDSGRHRGEREQSERFDRGDRERNDRERDRGERERLPAGRSRDINNDRGPGSRSGAVETKPEGKDSRERHR